MSLQIPDESSAVPTHKRPVSSTVTGTRTPHSGAHPTSSQTTSRKQRASHQVVSSPTANANGNSQAPPTPRATDVYSHPAAVAYAAQHPRRAIPKFGPYLLLQTLGEGEFGKVKLGLHCEWGEEVAVKLIRRGSVDNQLRMSKVEREIEVLRSLKHPHIVRLYDVIETDKYIGIILEYASGGELFDHILAHRYLKEHDAARLFRQLISGVWYIHRKKIVHRDLKLENLLLDRHRNVIITDFGFANRFEHKADDLMQTSCGSPCYAAPELVISEGLYVGSAVDIWSCGVILYAMLAGYLPFDDDPANPDGDNINLLYKYIVNTPLSFPEYVSESARDILRLMLVPDPRSRASLDQIMAHPWLASSHHLPAIDGVPAAFGKTVEDLERAALEQHRAKRDAYVRQMRAATNGNRDRDRDRPVRSHSQHTAASPAPLASKSLSHQPDHTYVAPTPSAPLPSTEPMDLDDPFAAPSAVAKERRPVETAIEGEIRGSSRQRTADTAGPTSSPKQEKDSHHKKAGNDRMRHTIQVEYDEPSARSTRKEKQKEKELPGDAAEVSPPKRRPSGSSGAKPLPTPPPPQQATAASTSNFTTSTTIARSPTLPSQPTTTGPPPSSYTRRQPSLPDDLKLPPPDMHSPPETPIKFAPAKGSDIESQNATPPPDHRGHHKSRSGSVAPPAIKSIFPYPQVQQPLTNGTDATTPVSRVPVNGSATASSVSVGSDGTATTNATTPKEKRKDKDKGSRRNTMQLVVGTIKKSTQKMAGSVTPSHGTFSSAADVSSPTPPPPSSAPTPQNKSSADLPSTNGGSTEIGVKTGAAEGMSGASTSKAKKVMNWFRNGRSSMGVSSGTTATPTPSSRDVFDSEKASVPSIVTNPASPTAALHPPPPPLPQPTPTAAEKKSPVRSPSDAGYASLSFVKKVRDSMTVGGLSSSHSPADSIRVHHGAVDQSMVTVKNPPDVMKHVREVLGEMGVDVSVEGEYKYRIVRVKRRKASPTTPNGKNNESSGRVEAFVVSGSAGSNGVDKRGLPLPAPQTFSSGSMLKGLLMRRQSSQVSSSSPSVNSGAADDLMESPVTDAPPSLNDGGKSLPIYGDTSQDAGDEVRFSVELTRIDRLAGTYSLDIRRLKGNLRSYKFLYDTLRERADLR